MHNLHRRVAITSFDFRVKALLCKPYKIDHKPLETRMTLIISLLAICALLLVVFEEVIVAKRCMSNNERLHQHRVFFHQVSDTRIRVDDDLVR